MPTKKKILANLKTFSEQEYVRIYFWCFGVVAVWRLVLEIVNHTIVKIIPVNQGVMPGVLFGQERWLAWDGKWYYSIFERGYTFDPLVQAQSNVAFFPGFPLITQIFSSITSLNVVHSGLIVNFILTTFSAYFIFRIASILAKKWKVSPTKNRLVSQVSVLLFLAFPSSLFLAAYYAESLLIFSLSGAIYFALKNRLLPALVFAGIASSSKILGVAVAPTVILMHYVMNMPESGTILKYTLRQVPHYVLFGIVGISGALAYMIFLYLSFGDPLLFTHIQTQWDRELAGNFIVTIWNIYYAHIFSPGHFGGIFNYLVALQAMIVPIIVTILALIAAVKYRAYWLILLTTILILLPASTSTLTSMNRYVFAATPVFCVIATLIVKYRLTRTVLPIIVVLSFIALLYQTTGFLSALHFAG